MGPAPCCESAADGRVSLAVLYRLHARYGPASYSSAGRFCIALHAKVPYCTLRAALRREEKTLRHFTHMAVKKKVAVLYHRALLTPPRLFLPPLSRVYRRFRFKYSYEEKYISRADSECAA